MTTAPDHVAINIADTKPADELDGSHHKHNGHHHSPNGHRNGHRNKQYDDDSDEDSHHHHHEHGHRNPRWDTHTISNQISQNNVLKIVNLSFDSYHSGSETDTEDEDEEDSHRRRRHSRGHHHVHRSRSTSIDRHQSPSQRPRRDVAPAAPEVSIEFVQQNNDKFELTDFELSHSVHLDLVVIYNRPKKTQSHCSTPNWSHNGQQNLVSWWVYWRYQ